MHYRIVMDGHFDLWIEFGLPRSSVDTLAVCLCLQSGFSVEAEGDVV